MKIIVKFFKALLYGIPMACGGGAIMASAHFMWQNILDINAGGNGWSIVLSFLLAFMEFLIIIGLLVDLGIVYMESKDWVKYKKSLSGDNNDSSSKDETSKDATDTSPKDKEKGKQKTS